MIKNIKDKKSCKNAQERDEFIELRTTKLNHLFKLLLGNRAKIE